MWNNLNLQCPVKDVCEYTIDGDKELIDNLPEFISLLTSSAEILTQDHPIWTEIKVLQNVQMKYKRILHCDKCLQLLQRVTTCLRKMVILNLSKTYLDLAEPFLAGIQKANSSSVLFPSSQQLEYVLLRTQSAAKLICEGLHYSRETFCYLIQRLKVGHLILNLIMATSVTARVNILFKSILVQIFDIYRKLYSWHQRFKKGSTEWPSPLDLPDDLETWLKPEVSELLKPKLVSHDPLKFLSSFLKKNEDETEIIDVEAIDENESMVIDDQSQVNLPNQNDIDLGEVIPRAQEECGVQLTESQNILLEKIKRAKNFKSLKVIWDNLDISSEAILQLLTPHKIRQIDKIFLQAKNKIKNLKQSNQTTGARRKQVISVTKLTGIKFAKQLGLVGTKSHNFDDEANSSHLQIGELKPVKTFKKLKQLYNTLYHILQSSQQYKNCDKLKKLFRSRKGDIKLLIQSGEKVTAKKLIFCTSKVFLTRFQQHEC
ncbi:DUF4477 domain-containing protein [Caerostris darwini]|uniref:DUF4477 domain-containing protein n=1 Tax=Caerostris darwini TaxID=1538125 RepID=A0AAV4VPX0_9ARAC|nr:DUF4477 domain-containing protein [Caerostris darwini]